jgi:hypothetical protein
MHARDLVGINGITRVLSAWCVPSRPRTTPLIPLLHRPESLIHLNLKYTFRF